MKKIVLFASGSGSNAVNIVKHFDGSEQIQVTALFCNNSKAAVIEKMHNLQIPVIVFNKKNLNDVDLLLQHLEPDLIVLAGFLWLMPIAIIQRFPNKIINLHPSLLPKFGGKGMYGMRVHEAVLAASESVSGVTVHQVSAEYDQGKIILQEQIDIEGQETPESLAAKIHSIEYEILPKAIKMVLNI